MRAFVSLQAAFFAAAFAQAPQFTITDLGDRTALIITAINNNGQLVGCFALNPPQQAFRTASNAVPNSATDGLGTLGGATSCANGINLSGQAVGSSTTADGKTHGFRTAANAKINPATDDIGTLGSYPTTAAGINDFGQVVGGSVPSGGTLGHAFRTGPNSAINPATDDIVGTGLGTNSNSTGETINAAGNVQGSFTTNNNAQGFVYANGKLYQPIGVRVPFESFTGLNNQDQMAYNPNPQAATVQVWRDGTSTQLQDCSSIAGGYCAPNGINDSLQVVGTFQNSPQRAFLYSAGTMYDLNTLIPSGSGFTLGWATLINARGQIIAAGNSSAGQRWFRLDPVQSIPPSPIPSKVGVWRPSVYNMVAEDVDGSLAWNSPPDEANFFGQTGDTVILGDWNGNGHTCMGIFRPSSAMFALDMNCNGQWDPGIDRYGFFGQNGDDPIVGDWTGDGKSKIGIYRPTSGLFALDVNNNLTYDAGTDRTGKFGTGGDTPIIGDWTGSGISRVGTFNNGIWKLDSNNDLVFDGGDATGTIGQAGDTPLLGDWNGDGRTKVGIYRPSSGMFAEDYDGSLTWGGPDRAGVLGPANSTPVVGDWTGTGITRVGVVYGSEYWALDTNGNLVWDSGIKWGGFGATGDTPVVGRW